MSEHSVIIETLPGSTECWNQEALPEECYDSKQQLQNFVFVEKTVKPRISRNLAYYKQLEMIFEEKINKPKITETDSEGEKCSFTLIKKLDNLCCWLGSILPCLGSQTFPALELHMAELVTVITLHILLCRVIQGLSRRLMLGRLRRLMVADVRLKGSCNKCLLWGGCRSTAAKLLFPTILLQKFGA